MHHAYFWRGQHGDRLEELVTCCDRCHTHANHQPNGKLWGFNKKLPRYTGAAFMNTVKWYIYENLKDIASNVNITYGAKTKLSRVNLGLEKSHINDAYSMGRFRPMIRAESILYIKRRRNNRCLEKFYDAKYIDIRDGQKKSGSQLSCGRINRRESRCGEKNERIFRGEKTSKGKRSIRKTRYEIQSGDILRYEGKIYVSKGCHCNGTRVMLNIGDTKKSIAISKVKLIRHVGGWIQQKVNLY